MTTDHWVGIVGIGVIAIAATAVIFQLNSRSGSGSVNHLISNIGGITLSDLYKSPTSKG